jgi:hypothetical protein
MEGESARPRIMLGLADDPDAPLASDVWVGAFISLGSLLRRYSSTLGGRQLVLAISVPRRDYVAALIGSGWMLSAPTPELGEPIDVFRGADRSTCLRAVTDRMIVTGSFSRLDETRNEPRVLTGGRTLPVSRYKAVVELDGEAANICADVPQPGFLATLTGAASSWLERLAAPSGDLALVGTAKWLHEDLNTLVGNGGQGGVPGTPLSNYVLPITDRAATWSTPVIPAARLGEGDTLPDRCVLAILDRYGAIRYLNDITVPIVLCIVDRSIADESAAETIIEARLSNSQPISVVEDLRWTPPRVVEALAFTVAL